jgi:endonuclease G
MRFCGNLNPTQPKPHATAITNLKRITPFESNTRTMTKNYTTITRRMLTLLGTACLITVSSLTHAQSCDNQYAMGKAPVIVNKAMNESTRPLCFTHFAVMHSGITRTPLWSAEHLTPRALESARETKRVNDFHEESQLPPGERANLRDYARSGYDRGHMAPSGDMPDAASQAQSFSLANMIPQDPDNNRNLWEGIESALRTRVKESGELYVITGPLFVGSNLRQLNGRVTVPTQIFKAVYDPRSKSAAAYLVDNAPGMNFAVISIAELEKKAGINLFPGTSEAAKSSKMDLPQPTPHGFGSDKHSSHASGTSAGSKPMDVQIASMAMRHLIHWVK